MTPRITQLFGALTLLLTTSCEISLSSRTPPPTVTSEQARVLATAGVTHNAEWIPYTEEVNGVLMALVPAGCFQMGSTDDQIAEAVHKCEERVPLYTCDPAWYLDGQPVHGVCFEEPFWLDVTEVTNSQFTTLGGQAEFPGYWIDADRPRETIRWTEADAFCQKRGARLPNEAEWEYAARGPDGLLYPWGNVFMRNKVVWNTSETSNVGSKPGGISWVGAYDLVGNVWEWVNDWYDTYPSEQQVNPNGPESGTARALRGFSWEFTHSDDLRAANRMGFNPDSRNSALGFRCAFSYQP